MPGWGSGRPRARRAHCAARPFVPARNAATPWRSGSTRAAAGEGGRAGGRGRRGDARWNGPRRRRQAGPTRAVRRLSTPAGPAMERPGPPGSCATPGRSRSAGLWRGPCGVSVAGSRGAGSGRPGSRGSEGRCPGEAAEGARPPGAGQPRGGASPAARGRDALPGLSTALRGSRCPAGGGPSGALGVHPGWREAFLEGGRTGPGRSPSSS